MQYQIKKEVNLHIANYKMKICSRCIIVFYLSIKRILDNGTKKFNSGFKLNEFPYSPTLQSPQNLV